MLLRNSDRNLLRSVIEGFLLLLLVVVAVGIGALAHLFQSTLPPSLLFLATVQVAELSSFATALFFGAALVLRAFRLFRGEWRQTFRRRS